MSFFSFEFLVFFMLFMALYWSPIVKTAKAQNVVLLAGSYAIYGIWNFEFIPLLILFSWANFSLGRKVGSASLLQQKKNWKNLAVFFNVGVLFYFKYVGFYIASIASLLGYHDLNQIPNFYSIAIPIGISYFVFRGLGYVLDVYKRKTSPIEDWLNFFNYIAFFPCVLAGPIDTSGVFSKQSAVHRAFNAAKLNQAGVKFLWGLFKKLTISSACGNLANPIVSNCEQYSSFILLLAAFAIAIQIYADFSGYCDMAEAVAMVIGFEITRNFNYPFFSTSIVEFWRRWHISLTIWLTSHVFTPLTIAFRNLGNLGLFLAILINMIVCGIWHGPNITFIMFGILHGCFFILPLAKGKKISGKKNQVLESLNFRTFLRIVGVFCLVSIADVIFTSESPQKALHFIQNLLVNGWVRPIDLNFAMFYGSCIISAFILIEWLGRRKEFPLQNILPHRHFILRWCAYAFVIFLIGLTMQSSITPFVYQQF
jgi:alginate O-acetyltransferase complex protein AlgI